MKTSLGIVLLGIAFLAAGCGGKQQPAASPESQYANEFAGAPQWVTTGVCSSPPIENPDATLCGVGQHFISSARRMGLARSGAQAQAAGNLAKNIEQGVQAITERYEAEYSQDDTVAAEGSTKTDDFVFAEEKLQGVAPVATWISPNDNMYVLVAVEVEAVMNALKEMETLSQAQKEYIEQNRKDFVAEAIARNNGTQ